MRENERRGVPDTGSDVTVFLSGDVMLGRGIDQILGRPGDPTLYEPWVRSALEYVRLAERRNGPIPRGVEPDYVWGESLAYLDSAGVAAHIINLETAVTDRGEPMPGKGIHYRMHPGNVDCITSAAIDCCVLANNHVLDWSLPGLEQTLGTLEAAGVRVVGAGRDAETARRPAVVELPHGGRVVVLARGTPSSGIPGSWEAGPDRAGVAMVATLSPSEVTEIAEKVGQVAAPGDLVVFSIHWGPNWGYTIPRAHREFAHELIERGGVHVVHGHSSHHPLGIEVYRDRPILYGCGDLINDYEGISGHEEYRPDLGILYLVTMDPIRGVLQRLEMVPMRMARFRLVAAAAEERAWLRETLSREGERLSTGVEEDGESLLLRW